jgi:hypothetical protein
VDKDPELKKYYEEHQELERKLAEFQHKHHLSPDEEVEKKSAKTETTRKRQNYGNS